MRDALPGQSQYALPEPTGDLLRRHDQALQKLQDTLDKQCSLTQQVEKSLAEFRCVRHASVLSAPESRAGCSCLRSHRTSALELVRALQAQ